MKIYYTLILVCALISCQQKVHIEPLYEVAIVNVNIIDETGTLWNTPHTIFIKADTIAAIEPTDLEKDMAEHTINATGNYVCLLYTSPSPRDQRGSRMPSSA